MDSAVEPKSPIRTLFLLHCFPPLLPMPSGVFVTCPRDSAPGTFTGWRNWSWGNFSTSWAPKTPGVSRVFSPLNGLEVKTKAWKQSPLNTKEIMGFQTVSVRSQFSGTWIGQIKMAHVILLAGVMQRTGLLCSEIGVWFPDLPITSGETEDIPFKLSVPPYALLKFGEINVTVRGYCEE